MPTLMKSIFSTHVRERIAERLRLSPESVAHLLDEGRTVLVGSEPGSNREHRLFYSPPDQQWFVAVQDHTDGVVVTLLPVDYHQTLAWVVSEEAKRTARAMATPTVPRTAREQAYSLKVYASNRKGKTKWRALGTWRGPTRSPQALTTVPYFLDTVARRLADKGFTEVDIEALYAKTSHEAIPVLLDLAPILATLRTCGP